MPRVSPEDRNKTVLLWQAKKPGGGNGPQRVSPLCWRRGCATVTRAPTGVLAGGGELWARPPLWRRTVST